MWSKAWRITKFIFWSFLFLGFALWFGWFNINSSLGIPEHFRLIQGREQSFSTKWPLKVGLSSDTSGIIQVKKGSEFKITPLRPGESSLDLSLFGVIPLKDRVISVVPELKVVPGGESIGVMLAAQGLIVAELARVRDLDGRLVSPAAEAGVRPGDLLIQINEVKINDPLDVEAALRKANPSQVTLKIKRSAKYLTIPVKPAVVPGEQGGYKLRLGIYLEDTAAGVGTLSFYHPETGKYAALGHMITDARTGEKAEITDGRIVPALVAGIRKGIRGQPGEKIGVFQDRAASLGVISENSPIGIFGVLEEIPKKEKAIPLAMAHEVEPGPAQILTVIENDTVESFEIEIIKVNRQSEPSGKGMVIEVKDPRLLEVTGGIVQGMSGSPIIQKGKLVGVVTHVFVNDPTKGYGVYAEWMASEAGIFSDLVKNLEPAA